jgi:uncharacterized small protein (DUF1192 family)
MRSLRARLERLERQVGRPPFVLDIKNMSRAEILDLIGLPPNPSREELDERIAALEEEIVRQAPGGLPPNPSREEIDARIAELQEEFARKKPRVRWGKVPG